MKNITFSSKTIDFFTVLNYSVPTKYYYVYFINGGYRYYGKIKRKLP